MTVHEVIFHPDGKQGRFPEGTDLLQAANELGVNINSICGGNSSCHKCIVKIERNKENLNKITEEEKFLGPVMIKQGYRLACCCIIKGKVIVNVPIESRNSIHRLQTEGLITPIKLDSPISIKNDDKIYYGDEKIGNLPENTGIYGFAVDVGTTKLAGYLVDLKTGNIVGVESMVNPQIDYGEDVITRLTHAVKHPDSLTQMHEKVLQGVKKILCEACKKANISSQEVYDFVFVGNSVMQHLLLKIDPTPLTRYPFKPSNTNHKDIPSDTLNLGNKNGRTHFLPLVSGFIGADCIASVLSTKIYQSEEPSFIIDIGTNTEIVIGNKDMLMAASCASGPAFEGAHITNGMRASLGAIESIWINEEFEPKYVTIGDVPPIGICGSGAIDLLSEMLKTGIMDTSGRIRKDLDHPRIRHNKIIEYVITWSHESSLKKDIVITQRDIRELQKGKAAMFSGAKTLIDKSNLLPKDLEKIYMAGAFGTYITPTSAINIGMIPEFNPSIIEQVGNAAGTGARMALISKKARKDAQKIQGKIEYIELASNPDYKKTYFDSMMFPHKDLSLFPDTIKRLRSENLVISKLHKVL